MATTKAEGRNNRAIPVSWAERFQPHILQRGYDYYLAGKVANLSADQGAWHARVVGRVPYSVTVPFEATGAEAACSCPHFADGNQCKHIAAVCYAIEDVLLGFTPVGIDRGAAAYEKDDAKELVNRLGVQELREIVCDLIARDDALRRRIVLEYGSIDSKAAFDDLSAELLALARYDVEDFSRATDDWETQYDASTLVNGTLRPLFNSGRLRDCADITIWLVSFLLSFGIGEGIQVAAGAMSACLDWWQCIVDTLSEQGDDAELREDACRRMAVALWSNRKEISDLADEKPIEKAISSIARAADDERTLELLLALVDEAIEQRFDALRRLGGMALASHGTSRWVLLRLELLKRSGLSIAERLASADDYMGAFDVTSALADELLAQGEWQRGVKVLEEGRYRSGDPREQRKFIWRLAELYEEQGDLDRTRELVRELVLNGGGGVGAADAGREDPFTWLKRLTDGRAWMEERETLIDAISYRDYRLRCLANEGMYEKLRGEIDGEWSKWQSAYSAFRLAREYREPLGQLFPAWLIRLYRTFISEGLERASSRAVYREQVELLSEMCAFEGGEHAAHELANELHAIYPRRSALKDELARAGL